MFSQSAPETFAVQFDTNVGSFVVNCVRAWSPFGVDRFFALAANGFYDDVRFFRVISGFVAQFGMSGNPLLTELYEGDGDPYHTIVADDPMPVGVSNIRGFVSFAAEQNPVTLQSTNRTVELFVNLHNNSRLDKYGFSPIGYVTEADMTATVDHIYAKYGEVQDICGDKGPNCTGPSVARIASEGNAYLVSDFPHMSYVIRAFILPPVPSPDTSSSDKGASYYALNAALGLGLLVGAGVGILLFAIFYNSKMRHRRSADGSGKYATVA
jgi:peptidyl-prolyl cis-trans isomerase A (cyclophilin A)